MVVAIVAGRFSHLWGSESASSPAKSGFLSVPSVSSAAENREFCAITKRHHPMNPPALSSKRLPRQLCLPSMVMLALVAFAAAGAGAQQSTPAYAVPVVAPGEFWVSSVPLGAKVYGADDETDLRSEKNFLGRTPLLLKSKPRFISLGVDSDDIEKRLSLGRHPGNDDFVDWTAESVTSSLRQDGGLWGIFIFLTYRPDYARRKTLIALFQVRDIDFDNVAALYPSGDNFKFDDTHLKAALTQKEYTGLTPAQIDQAVTLLHRGGKAALESSANIVIVEILGVNDIEILKSFGASKP
jgi:hypothetical protein